MNWVDFIKFKRFLWKFLIRYKNNLEKTEALPIPPCGQSYHWSQQHISFQTLSVQYIVIITGHSQNFWKGEKKNLTSTLRENSREKTQQDWIEKIGRLPTAHLSVRNSVSGDPRIETRSPSQCQVLGSWTLLSCLCPGTGICEFPTLVL